MQRNEATRTQTDMFHGQISSQQIDVSPLARIKARQLDQAGSIDDLSRVLAGVQETIMTEYPDQSTFTQYTLIAQILPGKLPSHIGELALRASQSPDEHIAEMGRNAFALLNMKTILSAVEAFPPIDRDDALQEAILTVINRAPMYDKPYPPTSVIREDIHSALARYVARDELMEVLNWVREGDYARIRDEVDTLLREYPDLPVYGMTRFVDDFIAREGNGHIARSSLDRYVQVRFEAARWDASPTSDVLFQAVEDAYEVDEALKTTNGITPLQAQVIRLRFGLDEFGIPLTLKEVGEMLGKSQSFISDIEQRSLHKLHYSSLRNR